MRVSGHVSRITFEEVRITQPSRVLDTCSCNTWLTKTLNVPEAEWGSILPRGLGWPLMCAVATVASPCTGLIWARPEVPWIEVSPEWIRRSSKLKGTCGWSGGQRSISDASGASREVPAIADDCSRHKRCSSLARRDCKVESAALSMLVLTERGCVHSCGLPSNFGVSRTRFENLLALRYILYKRTAFL